MCDRTLVIFLVLFSYISPCLMANGRKYDVETEAFKLYGEDFRTVLRRFRKTPDYLKILNDKMRDLRTYVSEMSLQVLHYFHTKMAQRVNDIIGVARVDDGSSTSSSPMLYYHAYGNRRQQDDMNQEEYSRIGIKVLDSYKMFGHPLTVQERNSFKDLGFEFAGNIIHSIIFNMGPVDTPPKSTRQPFGGDLDKVVPTINEHHTHEVTTEASSNVARAFTEETTTETFRFRVKEKKVKETVTASTDST